MAQTITAFAKQNWTKGERFWEGSVPLAVEEVRVAVDRTSMSVAQVPEAHAEQKRREQSFGLPQQRLGLQWQQM